MPNEINPAARTVNQFLDLAGSNEIVRVKDNGNVSTRNSVWNKIITFFRGNSVAQDNQRTAQAFKDALANVAQNFDYSPGQDGYHPENIFHHFTGLGTTKRSQVIQSVLNSGILAEELNGAKPLTGRKIQEVIEQISSSGADLSATTRRELFAKVEQGIGLYHEGRAKFLEAGFDRSKLEGINIDTFDAAYERLNDASGQLDSVIINIRQDVKALIEEGETESANYVLGQLKHAGDLQSQAVLFKTELNYHRTFNEHVAPLLARFEKAQPHLDAITLNFANLNPEQIQARDELIAIHSEIRRASDSITSQARTLKRNLANLPLDNEQKAAWESVSARFDEIQALVKEIEDQSGTVQITKTTPRGGIKSQELRNEETHIAPSEIITAAEITSVEAEIAKLEEAQKNPGAAATPKKSALKKSIAPEALNQIRTGKKVGVSSVLKLSRDTDPVGSAHRKGVSQEKGPAKDADLPELNEPGDNYGIYDEKGRFRSDTFSNLAKNSRVSLDDAAKAANAGKANRQNEIDRNAAAREKLRDDADAFVEKLLPGSETFKVLASNANVNGAGFQDLDKDSLYTTLISQRITDHALSSSEPLNDAAAQKLARKALTYVAGLSTQQAKDALSRLIDIQREGHTLLTSLTGREIRGLDAKPRPVAEILGNYLRKLSDSALGIDLLLGADEIGTDDRDTAKRVAFDLALSSLKGSQRDLLYSDILEADSPYRHAFLAAAGHTNNPENKNDPALSLASSEIVKSLTTFVYQLGQNVGITQAEINQTINPLDLSTDKADYQGFVDGVINAEALSLTGVANQGAAKSVFDNLTPYINDRKVQIDQAIAAANS